MQIIEITVCYDVYFDLAFTNNREHYEPVQNFLTMENRSDCIIFWIPWM